MSTGAHHTRRTRTCTLTLLLTIGLALSLGVSTAGATIASVFTGMASPSVKCTLQASGQRWCSAKSSRVASWDSTPIDVSVTFPPAPAKGADGNFPAIGVYHGWGGSKQGPNTPNVQRFVAMGFAVFSMSDRGWGASCGEPASREKLPAWASCAHGYIHMDSMEYEARDAQYLLGQLADEAVIDPQRIGAFGASYGGMLSVELGTLKDRTMLTNGTLIPWTSPLGKAMKVAGATPQAMASDLAEALMANGSTLDYVASSPYLGPNGDLRPGVQKTTIMTGFYEGGLHSGFLAEAGTDPTADLADWIKWTNAPGPYDTPEIFAMLEELTLHHSAYYVSDSEAPAPMLMANGLNDDFVPADEPVRLYNRIRADHPGTPVGLFFGDFGHARSQDKSADMNALAAAQSAWLAYYVKGEGAKPQEGLETFSDTCPSGLKSGGPWHFASYPAMERGEVRLTTSEPQTIAATGTEHGVEFSQPEATACTTVSSSDNPAVANYHTFTAPENGFTLAGAATVVAYLKVTGESDQLAERLLDVSPTGQETLVERGLLRPQLSDGMKYQVFQLHPNVWHVEAGHSLKLELLPDDSPYSHLNVTSPDTAAQHPITVLGLQLRVPVMDEPGADGGKVKTPAARVLPPGYTLAPGF